ncbi:MAG: TiaS agmantine-binding domain-containing protein [Candidatus Thorarchaeota archaeon]|jgi:tRNA(Ile2)-agmatinylcytidine synthase
MSKKLVQIGMDDIDSPEGRCTTHFASILVEKLDEWNVEWTDYPNLIRLNPGIPYRTRGNGAVALRFLTDETDEILPMIENLLVGYVDDEYPNTNPGVVILNGNIPEQVLHLSKQALWRIVPIELAKRVIDACEIAHVERGNGRGLIGALASVSNTLQEDHTYEYIAYRSLEDCNDERVVDEDSVRVMDKKMGECVFSNLDRIKDRIMIEPHGPDPVLFGVRGETSDCVIRAGRQVKSKQRVDRWMVFRSNQGTGEHLNHRVEVKNLRPYMAAVVTGKVVAKPKMIEGGHSIFSIEDDSGKVDCAAYEPSGEFRETVMKLIQGDKICLHAGVRPASRTHGLTLNLEGLDVVELAPALEVLNPVCPKCGKRMKSAGSGKGYKCVKCGYKDSEIGKIAIPITRNLSKGLILPPTRAQRHLTRPLVRANKMNSGTPASLEEKWHSHS